MVAFVRCSCVVCVPHTLKSDAASFIEIIYDTKAIARVLEFKGVGNPTEDSTHAKRLHVLIVHEAVVSITDGGVQVSS